MGYMHIENLYKDQSILVEPELYALEKVHGTSAHIAYFEGENVLRVHSGGMSNATLRAALPPEPELLKMFSQLAIAAKHAPGTGIVVYGEAYGGKQQGMSDTYGKAAAFIVFDVQVGGMWLDVPEAAQFAAGLGLEFVPYERVKSDLKLLDAERDRPSEVAKRRGITESKPREGVVLRPLTEKLNHFGRRLIAKHKTANFRETATVREVGVPTPTLLAAFEIAKEYVTEQRLAHVLQKIPEPHEMKQTPIVQVAMCEDVQREAGADIVWSEDARRAVGKATMLLFKAYVTRVK